MLAISFSVYGWLAEVGNLLKLRGHEHVGEGFGTLGVGVFFFMPALVLYQVDQNNLAGAGTWQTITKIAVYIMAIPAAGLIISAIARFVSPDPNPSDTLKSDVKQPDREPGTRNHRGMGRILFTGLLALLAIAADLIGIWQFISTLHVQRK